MTARDDTTVRDRGDELLARYGDELDDEGMSEAQKREFLLALYQIMQAFVDLGFSVKSGDNFLPDTDLGMDDVLEYLILEPTIDQKSTTKESDFNPDKENKKEE